MPSLVTLFASHEATMYYNQVGGIVIRTQIITSCAFGYVNVIGKKNQALVSPCDSVYISRVSGFSMTSGDICATRKLENTRGMHLYPKETRYRPINYRVLGKGAYL